MQRKNGHVGATNICFNFVKKHRQLSVFYTSKEGGRDVWIGQPTSQLWQGFRMETEHGNHTTIRELLTVGRHCFRLTAN